ncbi:hypothetical protein M569_00211, partial [Genlisea aurea]
KRKGGSLSASSEDVEMPLMNIRSILSEIDYLGSSHVTWKQKKEMENRRVVSLGGKPVKKQRLPLSVARVMMKKQKQREAKLSLQNAEIARYGGFSSSITTCSKGVERKKERILRSRDGKFKNGVLNVGHLLRRQPSEDDGVGVPSASGKGRKNKGKNRKGNGKRK